MDLGIKGKVAIVAGGARGCGRAIVEGLAREGARVGITSRNEAALTKTISELTAEGLEVLPLLGNMEEEADVKQWMTTIRSKWDHPQILVINPPGFIHPHRGFENTTNFEFDKATSPYVMPIVHLLREALPEMRARKWGRLVNIASVALKEPHRIDPMYSASMRVATAPMLKILAHEYGKDGITFNTIATGNFKTELSTEYMQFDDAYSDEFLMADTSLGRWGRPEEMGAVVTFLCSEPASYLTSEVIRVDGGYGRSLF
jgi:3-oxoacyl-[acyl-carrier protein] reductase